MAKCQRTAVAKVILGGNDPKYACDKCLKKVKAFAKQFNTKVEITQVDTSETCENDV